VVYESVNLCSKLTVNTRSEVTLPVTTFPNVRLYLSSQHTSPFLSEFTGRTAATPVPTTNTYSIFLFLDGWCRIYQRCEFLKQLSPQKRRDIYIFANTERRGTELWSLSLLQTFGYDHVTPRPEMQKPKKESYTAGVNKFSKNVSVISKFWAPEWRH